jgi:hypothetical protein
MGGEEPMSIAQCPICCTPSASGSQEVAASAQLGAEAGDRHCNLQDARKAFDTAIISID